MDTIYNLFPKDLASIVDEYSKDINFSKVIEELEKNVQIIIISHNDKPISYLIVYQNDYNHTRKWFK